MSASAKISACPDSNRERRAANFWEGRRRSQSSQKLKRSKAAGAAGSGKTARKNRKKTGGGSGCAGVEPRPACIVASANQVRPHLHEPLNGIQGQKEKNRKNGNPKNILNNRVRFFFAAVPEVFFDFLMTPPPPQFFCPREPRRGPQRRICCGGPRGAAARGRVNHLDSHDHDLSGSNPGGKSGHPGRQGAGNLQFFDPHCMVPAVPFASGFCQRPRLGGKASCIQCYPAFLIGSVLLVLVSGPSWIIRRRVADSR